MVSILQLKDTDWVGKWAPSQAKKWERLSKHMKLGNKQSSYYLNETDFKKKTQQSQKRYIHTH